MTTREDENERRREIIRRLEDEETRLNAEKSAVERELAEVKARILRAQSPYPPGDICRACWDDHGVHSKMQPQSGDRGVDAFRCGKCGHVEERKVF